MQGLAPLILPIMIKGISGKVKHYYNLYILKQSLTRYIVSSDAVAWRKTVLATSRTDALDKCRKEIVSFCREHIHENIKVVSVYVGRRKSVTGSASRLHPIRVEL